MVPPKNTPSVRRGSQGASSRRGARVRCSEGSSGRQWWWRRSRATSGRRTCRGAHAADVSPCGANTDSSTGHANELCPHPGQPPGCADSEPRDSPCSWKCATATAIDGMGIMGSVMTPQLASKIAVASAAQASSLGLSATYATLATARGAIKRCGDVGLALTSLRGHVRHDDSQKFLHSSRVRSFETDQAAWASRDELARGATPSY